FLFSKARTDNTETALSDDCSTDIAVSVQLLPNTKLSKINQHLAAGLFPEGPSPAASSSACRTFFTGEHTIYESWSMSSTREFAVCSFLPNRPSQSCGDDGDRTRDLVVANHALSQLSYIPSRLVRLDPCVGVRGFEPRTSALSELRSSQLSY